MMEPVGPQIMLCLGLFWMFLYVLLRHKPYLRVTIVDHLISFFLSA